MNQSLLDMHRLVWVSLMAAVVAASSYLVIPIGPIPFSLQPVFVFLAGYLLGAARGFFVMCLYLAAGIIGLPVFAGGAAGVGHLIGPTGGYLVGFLVSPLLTGRARAESENGSVRWISGLFWGIIAIIVTYGLGFVWLKTFADITWARAFAVGVVPFAPWDMIKIAVDVWCCRYLQKYNLAPR
jgi:biotin transport system substrate-specific component